LHELARAQGASLESARTLAVNAVVVIEVFYLLNCRSLVDSPFKLGFFTNRWVWISIAAMAALQLLFTYAPAVNRVLQTAPISGEHWLWILLVGLASYSAVEGEKWLRRRSASPAGGAKTASAQNVPG
jgi:magnesium-transporting ATPase (P-type)